MTIIDEKLLMDINIDGESAINIMKESKFHWDQNGQFSNPLIQKRYVDYCLRKKSPFIFIIVGTLIMIWGIADAVFNYKGTTYFEILFAFLNTIFLLSSLTSMIFLHYTSASPKYCSTEFHSMSQLVLIVSLHFVILVKLAKFVLTQEMYISDGNFGPYILSCPNFPKPASILSLQTANGMVLVPILLTAILYDHRFYVIFILVTLIAIGLISSNGFTVGNVYTVMTRYFIILALFHQMQVLRLKDFVTHTFLIEIMEARERNADAIHALEMRHMIGNVAHDLKTPLSAFIAGLDVIKIITDKAMQQFHAKSVFMEDLKENYVAIRDALKNMYNANAFMLMEINRCVDYTKAIKGIKLTPKLETTDVREVMRSSVDVIMNIQEKVPVKLMSLGKEINPYVRTDKQWLQENILCLLSNAVKYATEGPALLSVTLINHVPASPKVNLSIPKPKTYPLEPLDTWQETLQGENTSIFTNNPCCDFSRPDEVSDFYLLFEVEDDGSGVDPEFIQTLFTPFKQANRYVGGTGLGLYSLAKRVEALNGGFGVKNRDNGLKGSVFWFAIPYYPELHIADSIRCDSIDDTKQKTPEGFLYSSSEEDKLSGSCEEIVISQEEIHQAVTPMVVSKSPPHALLVDDSLTIIKLYSMNLKKLGFLVSTAENGAIAVSKLKEKIQTTGKEFDVILMDIQMPVMDGLEATKHIRHLEWKEFTDSKLHQLIIGVSANSDQETIREAFHAGVDDFLSKPFTNDSLISLFKKYNLPTLQ